MGTIGDRLREERQRLDRNQTELGELGGVQKRAQINYESGERFPDAAYLAAIAAVGADVRYIITGDRKGPPPLALSPEEQVLLDGYRSLDKKTQKRMLAFVLGGDALMEKTARVSQQINAPVIGGVAGRDLVHKGRKKKSEAGDQQ